MEWLPWIVGALLLMVFVLAFIDTLAIAAMNRASGLMAHSLSRMDRTAVAAETAAKGAQEAAVAAREAATAAKLAAEACMTMTKEVVSFIHKPPAAPAE